MPGEQKSGVAFLRSLKSTSMLRIFSVDVPLSTNQCKVSVPTYARNSVGLFRDLGGF